MQNRAPSVVLIVEDNPDDVYFMQTALESSTSPRAIHIVTDGVAALAFLRREPPFEDAPRPNVVILDLNLPKLSGFEVLEAIKSDEKLRPIPVVVLTTSDAREDAMASYDRYATSFITKPQNLNEYATVLEKIGRFWLETVQLPK